MKKLRISLLVGLPLYGMLSGYTIAGLLKFKTIFTITDPYTIFIFDPAMLLFIILGFPLRLSSSVPDMIIGVFLFVISHLIFWMPISVFIIRLVEKRARRKARERRRQ